MRSIFVIGGGDSYACWMEGKIVASMKDADLVVFTGGADINPKLYGKNRNKTTFFSESRDAMEVEAFREAVALGKKMIGICRGAQLHCALAGGTLIQNMDHPAMHNLTLTGGLERWGKPMVPSCHHQMMNPCHLEWGIDYKLIGWCRGLSQIHEGEIEGEDEPGWEDNPIEPEIAVFNKIQSLAIQGHPEWLSATSPSLAFFRELLNMHMTDKL